MQQGKGSKLYSAFFISPNHNSDQLQRKKKLGSIFVNVMQLHFIVKINCFVGCCLHLPSFFLTYHLDVNSISVKLQK